MAREGGVVLAAVAAVMNLEAATAGLAEAFDAVRWSSLRLALAFAGKSRREAEAIIRAEKYAEAREQALQRLEPDRWADDGGPEEPPLYDYGRTPSGQFVRWERRP